MRELVLACLLVATGCDGSGDLMTSATSDAAGGAGADAARVPDPGGDVREPDSTERDDTETRRTPALDAVPLVVADAWEVVPFDEDPFADLASGPPEACEEFEYGPVDLSGMDVFHAFVNECRFLTVAQRLLVSVPAEAPIDLWVGHATMYEIQTVVRARVAVGADVDSIWHLDEPGPSPAYGSFEDSLTAPRGLEAGETVYFHLSVAPPAPVMKPSIPQPIKHGDSEWWFVSMTTPAVEEDPHR